MARGLCIRFDPVRFTKLQSRAALLVGEIAEKAGVSPAAVRGAASGREIGLRSARAIAGAFGVPLNRLRAADDPTAADTGAVASPAQTAA